MNNMCIIICMIIACMEWQAHVLHGQAHIYALILVSSVILLLLLSVQKSRTPVDVLSDTIGLIPVEFVHG